MTIGQFIVNREARRDAAGRLAIYRLPAGDGGGEYEIAGINDRYHPQKARELADLIQAGKHAEAEVAAAKYVELYTAAVASWHPDPRVCEFLRDCAFNRGPGGAAKILQQALTVAGLYTGLLDGAVGKLTREASYKLAAEDLIFRLLLARQWYERTHAGRSESSKFWAGLVNRWVDAAQFALRVGNPEVFGK